MIKKYYKCCIVFLLSACLFLFVGYRIGRWHLKSEWKKKSPFFDEVATMKIYPGFLSKNGFLDYETEDNNNFSKALSFSPFNIVTNDDRSQYLFFLNGSRNHEVDEVLAYSDYRGHLFKARSYVYSDGGSYISLLINRSIDSEKTISISLHIATKTHNRAYVDLDADGLFDFYGVNNIETNNRTDYLRKGHSWVEKTKDDPDHPFREYYDFLKLKSN